MQWFAILMAIAFFASGCSSGEGEQPPSTRTVVSAPRLISDADSVRDVRDLALHPSGGVWVVSSFDPHLFLLSPEGSLLARFGPSGPGPAELSNPSHFVGRSFERERVAVWDGGKRQVQWFGAGGAYEGGTPIPVHPGLIPVRLQQQSYVRAGRVAPLGSGFVRDVYPGQVGGPADLWNGALVRSGREGEPVDTVARFADLRDGTDMPSTGGSARLLIAPIPLWTTCSGRIAVLKPGPEEIAWIDSTGAVVETRGIDLPEAPITGLDKTRFLRQQLAVEARERGIDPNDPQMDRMVEQILSSGRAAFVEAGPPVHLLCGPEGELWVQSFSTERDPRGFGTTWTRVDAGGGQEHVEVPPGFSPMVIERNRMWGVQTDDLGVERVAVATIDRNG